MKKILYLTVIAILSLTHKVYATDEIIQINQRNLKTSLPSQLTLAETSSDWLDQLPYELKLHVYEQVLVQDMTQLSQINKSWHELSKHHKISWALTACQINHSVDLRVNDPLLNPIKAMLTGKAKLTFFSLLEFGLTVISDNKISSIELKDPAPAYYNNIFLDTVCTQFSNNDRTIHVGPRYRDNKRQTFITTDKKTITILPTSDDIDSTFAKKITNDGKYIVGHAYTTAKSYRGFYWQACNNCIKLLSSPDGEFDTLAQCVDENADLIGGRAVNLVNDKEKAIIWINKKHYFFLKDLLSKDHYQIPENIQLKNVFIISPDSHFLWGALNVDDDKAYLEYWSLMLPNDNDI